MNTIESKIKKYKTKKEQTTDPTKAQIYVIKLEYYENINKQSVTDLVDRYLETSSKLEKDLYSNYNKLIKK